MAKLIYSMLTSLDGYIEDEHGNFGWAEPADEEVHSYVNELASSVGTSRSARTRIEREFDPDAVRRLKANANHDITVDGPELAGYAVRAGLVDEIQPILCPVIVGGGKRFFPDGVRLDLDLLEERRFASGVAALRYAVRR